MTLAFVLTMPCSPTWNGRWSGEGKLYAIVENVRKQEQAELVLAGSPYMHRWDDGWVAQIAVKAVDAAEARRLRKQTCGFNGYGWMVRNIISHQQTNDRLKQVQP